MYPGFTSFRHIPPVKTMVESFPISKESSFRPESVGPYVTFLQTKEDYLILLATPGMCREDISVFIEDGIITISTDRKNNPDKPVCFLKDPSILDYADWTRAFLLPEDADAMRADANYKNAELYIHIPRGLPGDHKVSSEVYVY